MNARAAGIATTIALSVLIGCPPGVEAQSRPAPQRVLSRGVTDTATPVPRVAAGGSAHVLYGRIEAIHGAILSVRARGGRLQRVDASEAIRTDNYSAPLFIGKLVEIHGFYDASRTLHGQTVMKVVSFDSGTAPDR